MKRWIHKSLIVSLLSLAVFACQKVEDVVVVREGTAPVLTASATEAVLLEEAAADSVMSFSWSSSDFGFPAAVNYVMQVARAGADFADPRSIELGSALQRTLTVAELNDIATRLGLEPSEAGALEARIRAEVAPSFPAAYSNVVALSITPFEPATPAEPTFLWVPGAYQGWAPATANRVVSMEDNGIYEGYVYFTPNNLMFKFTPAPNWDDDWGGTSTATGGTLVPKGTDLRVPAAGQYQLRANINTLTWSFVLTNWGLVGDATPGGWNTDTPMTFDPDAKVLKATLPLTAGNFKFRANESWTLNYGAGSGDGVLTLDGPDIPVTQAGNYEITLNLNDPLNITYTITRL
jgi:starch-binding outer membrane protein SusE/F